MKTVPCFTFLLALAICLSAHTATAADDRMAGPRSVPQKVEKEVEKKAPKPEKPADKKPTEQKPPEQKPVEQKEEAAPEEKKAAPESSEAAETRANDEAEKAALAAEEKNAANRAAATKIPVANIPRPKIGQTMDRTVMESLGPLTNPLKGGLGNDMWAGSPRSVAQDYIPQLPAGDNTFPPAQLLARRVLLSNGDVSMMRNDKSPEPGQDLFTLRLEKLVEIGAYADAVKLYTLIEGEPGHGRLARAAVLALMSGGAPAQACLEARTAQPDPDAFWAQVEAVCNFIQARSVRAVKESGSTKDQAATVSEIPGSKVLTTLVSRPDYRHTISNPDDLAELSQLERAVLKGMGRLDYSRLKIRKIESIPAPILMTMAGDPNMPPGQRLAFNIEAAARGLLDTDGLGAVYTQMASGNSEGTSLPARYAAITKATATKAEKSAIVAALLESRYDSKLPAHLLPFTPMIAETSPDGLSANALETGLYALLQAGIVPPERWVTAWLGAESSDSKKTRSQVLLYLANLVPENLPTNSVGFTDEQVKTVLTGPESPESLEIWAVFAGLGRLEAIENIAPADAYEKHVDLTLVNDYVMPSGSLLEKIRDAAQNGRLGETALLASVALNSGYPDKIHPGVVKEVLKSLETVGLKEEARHMALGVVMGLKQ